MARRLEDSIEDQRLGIVRIELSDGRRVNFDSRTFARIGLSECLRYVGVDDSEIPQGRVPVERSGEIVGTVPADFDPLTAKSKSWIYDVRPGDFKRVGNKWVADRMLGDGDLDMLVGFARV